MPSAREATAELVKILKRAPSLADGDRSVRGRVASLMGRLYPAEPARSRAEFQALVRPTRAKKAGPPPLPKSPSAARDRRQRCCPARATASSASSAAVAMGVVYEAFHLDLGRKRRAQGAAPSFVWRRRESGFVAEARAVARVSHEALVTALRVRLHERRQAVLRDGARPRRDTRGSTGPGADRSR